MSKLPQDVIDRFWSKVNKSGDCWLWIAGRSAQGYGKFFYSKGINGQKNLQAHRISYLLKNGELINGLVIDHVCKNTSCVNPMHLRQVTHRFNTVDNSISPVANNARRTHCACGVELSIKNIIPNLYKKHGWRHCVFCNRKKIQKYRLKDPELSRLRGREYRLANLERLRKHQREYSRKKAILKKAQKDGFFQYITNAPIFVKAIDMLPLVQRLNF